MATCKEVHTSVHKGVTTVVRCSEFEDHGSCHSGKVAWYAYVPATENWQPGDVVMDAHTRYFMRLSDNTWWRFGFAESWNDDYPIRPLTKFVPEQTP